MITIGAVFRRLVRPYRQPPLCLALLLDDSTSIDRKKALSSVVRGLPECCQDEGFVKPLLRLIDKDDDLLSPSKKGHRIMQAAFMSKNHNIQVENNFARAQSWLRCNRGRTDRSFNLQCKHILAEVKHNHTKACSRQGQPKANIAASEPSDTTPLADDAASVPLPIEAFSGDCLRSELKSK